MGWNGGLFRPRRISPLITLDEVLQALGDDGVDGRRRADVPLADVVGTLARTSDFDDGFRLVNHALRDRWQRLATAMLAGVDPPPVELVQLGDLYFVVDGHHRVSVARALGRDSIPARVLRVCTVAYARCRLRPEHLATKAAERRFLERVPLEVALRCALWLDSADDWLRLADAAEAWGFRRSLQSGKVLDRCELARAWWAEEVAPVVESQRRTGRGAGKGDVELYVAALSAGDAEAARLG